MAAPERKPIDSLAELVRMHGQNIPDHPAIIFGDTTVTWGALLSRAATVAQALYADEVGPGDRIAFLDKNCIEHFEVLFGAALVGAVSIDVNWRLKPPEIRYVVEDADAKVLIAGQNYAPTVDTMGDGLKVGSVVVGGHTHHTSYEAWIEGHSAIDPGHIPSADDVAFQLYSSGTTGHPKGVMSSNDAFFSLMRTLSELWEIGQDAVVLIALPLFHIGGAGWVTAGMYHGATTVLMREMDPGALTDRIPEHRVTHTVLVPAAIQSMLDLPGISAADFSSLRVMGYGASPISETVLARAIEVFDCKFWQGYGLTETTGGVTLLGPEDHVPHGPNSHRLRSCGTVAPGFELRVVDPIDETDVPAGENGEVWVRGKHMMKGYWKLPEETEKAMAPGGWFRTGDVGYLDADGYLYLQDRIKDMIVSGGENVYPAEVENVLMAHPRVADAAVIGVPDEQWGEVPKAILVLRPGITIATDELEVFCRSRLADYKCPRTIEFVDALPRNPTGKILKTELRAPYWEGRDRFVS